jgi:hypothetical protein
MNRHLWSFMRSAWRRHAPRSFTAATLAAAAGVTEAEARSALERACELGHLERTRRDGHDEYRLSTPQGGALP